VIRAMLTWREDPTQAFRRNPPPLTDHPRHRLKVANDTHSLVFQCNISNW
jgi:hypothetical protein